MSFEVIVFGNDGEAKRLRRVKDIQPLVKLLEAGEISGFHVMEEAESWAARVDAIHASVRTMKAVSY